MAEWRIERDGNTVVTTERVIREDLRVGRLSGAEMVRPPDATGWLPLHTLALFSEEVPTRATSPDTADGKIARGWVIHLLTFLFITAYAGRGTIPIWAFFWGLGLLAHTLRGLPAAARALRSAWRPTSPPQQPAATVAEDPTPGVPAPAAQPASRTAFIGQVHDAVGAVRGVWSQGAQALGPLPDLDGLTQAAEQLETRHEALLALHHLEDRDTLEAEFTAASARAETAPDAVTADVFLQEAAAIADRLAGIDAAMAVSEQLAARKRTLLHQLAGLRLAAGQTAATHDGTEPARAAGTLVEKTANLRDALQASAEVDDALVRARKAAAAARSTRQP